MDKKFCDDSCKETRTIIQQNSASTILIREYPTTPLKKEFGIFSSHFIPKGRACKNTKDKLLRFDFQISNISLTVYETKKGSEYLFCYGFWGT